MFALQYPESTLQVETKQVMMTNVSSLPLSVVLKATYPFQLLVEDPRWAPVNVKSSQSVCLMILIFLYSDTCHTTAARSSFYKNSISFHNFRETGRICAEKK